MSPNCFFPFFLAFNPITQFFFRNLDYVHEPKHENICFLKNKNLSLQRSLLFIDKFSYEEFFKNNPQLRRNLFKSVY